MKLKRLLKPDIDLLNTIRRYIGQKLDQLIAISWKKIKPLKSKSFDGDARFALITVNFSTTYYLKLMLLTLCNQKALDKISKIIIVDNGSKDGGVLFLKRLIKTIEKVNLIENKFIRTHARGLRVGIDYLQQCEQNDDLQSNVLMICDTDIIFRNNETLSELSSIFNSNKTAFAGELRYSSTVCPQAQASFLTIRRDYYARSDITPFVNHGSPAFWMQRSLWKAGLKLYDFRSNYGGYILHRGRTGVAAAGVHNRYSSFAKTPNNQPHYTGVENGQHIWQQTEKKYSELLHESSENALIDYLSDKLNL